MSISHNVDLDWTRLSPMPMFNVHDATTHFSRLLDQALQGEEVIIGRAGRPVARLVPYADDRSLRSPGGWEGLVRIGPDFDELPVEVELAFRGERP